jgi:hypothetical protein
LGLAKVPVGDGLIEAGEHVAKGPEIVLSPAVGQFAQDVAEPTLGGGHVAVDLDVQLIERSSSRNLSQSGDLDPADRDT